MTLGPGRYDAICTEVRERTKAKQGVLLVVFGGENGDGFSMQATPELTLALPDLLRFIAEQIDRESSKT